MKAELIFHDKVMEKDRSIIEVKIWAVPLSSGNPYGYKYSMVYIKDGKRIFGYDNAKAKGDHRHYGGEEEPYKFKSINRLFEDFYQDLRRFKHES